VSRYVLDASIAIDSHLKILSLLQEHFAATFLEKNIVLKAL
jgi:hypothetical protein